MNHEWVQHQKLTIDSLGLARNTVRFVIVIIMLLLTVSLTGTAVTVTKEIILQRNVFITNFVTFVKEETMTQRIVSFDQTQQEK